MPKEKAVTPWLTPQVLEKLVANSTQQKLQPSEYLAFLLDHDSDRIELLDLLKNTVAAPLTASAQSVIEIINQYTRELDNRSDVDQYHVVVENIFSTMLESNLISMKVLTNSIAESERLNIPRVAYYWYGGSIAKHCARLFGTYAVYLWHDMLATESEVVFIGMPSNVIASYQLCSKLCRLLKSAKAKYKKDAGKWGASAEVEDDANQFISTFSRGICGEAIGIYDEDGFGLIHDYAMEHYRYAMR